MRITQRLLLAAALGLLVLSGWQAGQGVYMNAKAELAQVLLEDAWEVTKRTGTHVKAWDWADTWPVARISAPRVKGDAIVLAGASGEALAFGPGHLANTPLPGTIGISVIAAHRDTHFEFLKDVEIGDAVHLEAIDGTLHTYIVDDLKVVHADASGIHPHQGGKRLALVTCFPFGTTEQGPLRYVVFASVEEDLI
ncbi:MAG: class GN sortase [Rhodobiaceae bacterium]|nr:MAG: class GN sortase [Rhodobiaceae bacterium]